VAHTTRVLAEGGGARAKRAAEAAGRAVFAVVGGCCTRQRPGRSLYALHGPAAGLLVVRRGPPGVADPGGPRGTSKQAPARALGQFT